MEINENVSGRVASIIKYLGITKSKFATALNYPRAQSIYNMLEGKSNPSYDFFYKLKESEYGKTFNTDWIITGEGEMLNTTYDASEDNLDTLEEIKTEYAALHKNFEINDPEALYRLAMQSISNMDKMRKMFKFFDDAFELEVYKRLWEEKNKE